MWVTLKKIWLWIIRIIASFSKMSKVDSLEDFIIDTHFAMKCTEVIARKTGCFLQHLALSKLYCDLLEKNV